MLFGASSRLFVRGLSYVAISKCTTLESLYIVEKKIDTEHFKQAFGRQDGVIKSETTPMGNPLRKDHNIYCDSRTPSEATVLNHENLDSMDRRVNSNFIFKLCYIS